MSTKMVIKQKGREEAPKFLTSSRNPDLMKNQLQPYTTPTTTPGKPVFHGLHLHIST